MGASNAETALPTVIAFPQSYIQLLNNVFKVMDESAADAEASEGFRSLFTKDGIWKTPSATFSGIDSIAESGHSWERFRSVKSMQHWIFKVYVNDEAGKSLMLHGRIKFEMLDGVVVDKHFGARVEIEDSSTADKDQTPKLSFFQGWSAQQ